jgi:hypothetical protein
MGHARSVYSSMDWLAPGFDASTFAKNRRRLLAHAVAQRFLDEVVGQADHLGRTDGPRLPGQPLPCGQSLP